DAVSDANESVSYTGVVADVNGNNLTLTSVPGTIGTANNPLEINSSYSAPGLLTATALHSAYLTETAGDLNLAQVLSRTGDVTLTAGGGSMVGTGAPPAVLGNNIVLNATDGSIGKSTDDLRIDSAYTGAGVLTAFAENSIYITEVTYDGAFSNTLRVLKAKG